MDELVMIGVAGMTGLIVAAIIMLTIVATVILAIIHAMIEGDFCLIFEIISGIIVIALLYFGIGWWLQKTGQI
jgi:hypothetical protein